MLECLINAHMATTHGAAALPAIMTLRQLPGDYLAMAFIQYGYDIKPNMATIPLILKYRISHAMAVYVYFTNSQLSTLTAQVSIGALLFTSAV